jgi:hypothetical protein
MTVSVRSEPRIWPQDIRHEHVRHKALGPVRAELLRVFATPNGRS